jgi:hypothetical protein
VIAQSAFVANPSRAAASRSRLSSVTKTSVAGRPVYAHPGYGCRATLFTDYTFAVWHEGELVPVAKAYIG